MDGWKSSIGAPQDQYMSTQTVCPIQKQMLINLINSPYSLSRYVSNEVASIYDVFVVLKLIFFLSLLRLVLCGAYHPRLSGLPNVFTGALGKLCRPEKHQKFSENLWYTLWHTLSFCWNCRVLLYECISPDTPGWFYYLLTKGDSVWYWLTTVSEKTLKGDPGWPGLTISDTVRFFYLTQMAFWASNIVYLFLERKRSDFSVMLVHHVSTVLLLTGSYMMNLWRVGLVVLVLHDLGDILLYSAKTTQYSVMPRKVVDTLFVMFAVMFFISRLVLYPKLVVLPCLDYSMFREATHGLVWWPWDVPGVGVLTAFLVVLQVLHLFWFWLIMQIVVKTTLKAKSITDKGDIRSGDEGGRGESEDETDTGKCEEPASTTSTTSTHEVRRRKK
eukprot:GHVN01039140.1.p1 GENE.GHVN01039140.1~~GHVN01039140.1.p1  ORF type:complete len:387 (+),score=45.77 GHVN01039140.1:62-1222(+)